MQWFPFKKMKMFIPCSILMCGVFLSGAELKITETHAFPLLPGAKVRIETSEGDVRIQSWKKDSVRIEITKQAYSSSGSKARRIMDKIDIRIERKDHQLFLRDQFSGNINTSVLDLLNPSAWKRGRFSGRRVDYLIILPESVYLKINHNEGDVTIQDLQGEFLLDIDEGDCDLRNIRYQNCKVNIDEGNLTIGQLIGDSSSDLRLSINEGGVNAIQVNGHEVAIRSNEGNVKMKEICFQSIDSQVDEGDLSMSMTLMPQGHYRFFGSEGNTDIHLFNKIPMHLAMYSNEGRINTNLPLRIRRSDDSEQAREDVGESPEVYVKIYTEEGDINLRQD